MDIEQSGYMAGSVPEIDEDMLVRIWERMPWQIQELYVPVSCVKKTRERAIYMAENRLDSSRVVVIRATGNDVKRLRTESDIMDLLVLGCIPKKIMYSENEKGAILVREYLKGESLGGAVARLGAFSDDEVRTFGEDLCKMFMELYERSLSVNVGTLSPRNVIISEGRMKFVEPEGIEYFRDFSKNWNEIEVAIGELMEILITGDGAEPEAGSKRLRRVIARCKAGSGKNYGSVHDLYKALKATEPTVQARIFSVQGLIVILAVLFLAIAGIAISRIAANRNRVSPEEVVRGFPEEDDAEEAEGEPVPSPKE